MLVFVTNFVKKFVNFTIIPQTVEQKRQKTGKRYKLIGLKRQVLVMLSFYATYIGRRAATIPIEERLFRRVGVRRKERRAREINKLKVFKNLMNKKAEIISAR